MSEPLKTSGRLIDEATKTPRTDEQLKLEAFFDGIGIVETVEVEFAQQLETELTDKDRQLAEARAEIVELKRGAGSDTGTIVRQANSIGVMDKQLAETRAEIENLQWRVSEERAKTEAALELNDKALALVNEARADADHWKSECNTLQRMVHEARAEIERLKKLQQFATAINCAMLEADFDPEYLRGHECVAKHKLLSMLDLWRKKVKPRLPGFINDEIYRRDKLIEQMREALKGASKHFDRNYWNVKNDPDFEDLNEIWSNIEAALAAERGE